jgi:hypothetical protein
MINYTVGKKIKKITKSEFDNEESDFDDDIYAVGEIENEIEMAVNNNDLNILEAVVY